MRVVERIPPDLTVTIECSTAVQMDIFSREKPESRSTYGSGSNERRGEARGTDAFWYVRYKLWGDHFAMSGVYWTGTMGFRRHASYTIKLTVLTRPTQFNLNVLQVLR